MTVRTRFAPSPTGVLHIGSVRTALFCFLYAHHRNGEYLLRIEDTDRERSTPENVEAILDGLNWLGIKSQGSVVYQTQRFSRYREVIDKWLVEGKAYRCFCSREELSQMREQQAASGQKTRYDGRCRDRTTHPDGVDSVVRFKNPLDGNVIVEDTVRGHVSFRNSELDDIIIARADGTPTYNFTVVVDDADMAITHVIRGDDHLNNTPKQMNMIEALGASMPVYAHLPMILGTDGAKLSKRHGAVDVREYREQGYLPEALLNYLVRLGWSHGDQEFFTMDEMIRLFDISGINQSASAFNPDKLRWLNQQHIMKLSTRDLAERLKPFLLRNGFDLALGPEPEAVAAAYRERAETLAELANTVRYCYEDFSEFEVAAAKKALRGAILPALVDVGERLADLDEWTREVIGTAIADCAKEFQLGLGKIGQPLRVAVTGGAVSPPIDTTLELVGRERTLARIRRAVAFIESKAAAD